MKEKKRKRKENKIEKLTKEVVTDGYTYIYDIYYKRE